MGCRKLAEWIDVLFGVQTLGDPRSIVLNGGLSPLMARRRVFDAVFAELLWPFISVFIDFL